MARASVTSRRGGFTLIEVLVCIGVLAILAALLIPALGGSRSAARSTTTLSNIEQVAVGVQMYADGNKGLPPTFGAPPGPSPQPWQFDFGPMGTGNWFEHQYLYGIEVIALLEDPAVGVATGNPKPRPVVVHDGRPTREADFFLTNTLYAQPSFFNWETQKGPAQFGAQALGSVVHPSEKGMLWTPWTFSNGPVASCCTVDLPSPVAFFDLSATSVIMRNLRAGMWNLFEEGGIIATADPRQVFGTPVSNTFGGVRGVDR